MIIRFTAIIQDNLRQPAPPIKNCKDFVGAKFYCLHAFAEGNQRIRIMEKTLELSSIVLSTLSPYHKSLKSSSNTHTHTRLTALLSGTTRVNRYQKGKRQSGFN